MDIVNQLNNILISAFTYTLKIYEDKPILKNKIKTTRITKPEYKQFDYVTNLLLCNSHINNYNNQEFLNTFKERVLQNNYIKNLIIEKNKLINITINNNLYKDIVETLLNNKSYITINKYNNKNINLEFVSSNPTGPIHIGATRWAAYGDVLSNLLKRTNAKITKEYYFNDNGNQINDYVESIIKYSNNPDDKSIVYKHKYTEEISNYINQHNIKDDIKKVKDIALEYTLKQIKESLKKFYLSFDIFFKESSLYETHYIEKTISIFKEKNAIYYKDDALYLKTTEYGDTQDRVLIKSNKLYTYFASDCAYYLNKKERGFNLIVIILAADHHGYIKRLEAISRIFGDNPSENLKIIIGQMVTFKKHNELIKLSKRNNNIITLSDAIELLGADILRYYLLRDNINTTSILDINNLTSHKLDNPIYYVQYANVRIVSLLNQATKLNIKLDYDIDTNLLTPIERQLILLLSEYKSNLIEAINTFQIHILIRYIEELTKKFHLFYTKLKILSTTTQLQNNRMSIAYATKKILEDFFNILNIQLMDKM